eukprot:gb/GECG01007252.1/.p3 GENE.gb/GECG01007252.1/~~gb/GECG01007252.1/.p3  ORF type:complete len:159 (+),score=13.12 gb/GECG01007252.1/:128-604(+)
MYAIGTTGEDIILAVVIASQANTNLTLAGIGAAETARQGSTQKGQAIPAAKAVRLDSTLPTREIAIAKTVLQVDISLHLDNHGVRVVHRDRYPELGPKSAVPAKRGSLKTINIHVRIVHLARVVSAGRDFATLVFQSKDPLTIVTVNNADRVNIAHQK